MNTFFSAIKLKNINTLWSNYKNILYVTKQQEEQLYINTVFKHEIKRNQSKQTK